jgi:lysozyme family protein
MVFDFACGNPTAAAVRLQRMVGVADDGRIGPVTLAAVGRAWDAQGVGLLDRYHAARLGFYRQLTAYRLFGRGWEARATRCLVLTRAMAEAQRPA